MFLKRCSTTSTDGCGNPKPCGNPHFHDISGLFDDSQKPYYVDEWHVSESGNRRIAAAMVDDAIELIERLRAAAAEPVRILPTTDNSERAGFSGRNRTR